VKKKNSFVSQDLERQREYVEACRREGFRYPLIAAEAFVQGMRESGYKTTATAIDEFIDNAIQAQADEVHIIAGYNSENTTKKKFDKVAIVDNGHGMDPEMIRLAVIWGGTHRWDDRNGFGRFGFGLPSASVSIARCFTVYSKVAGSHWYSVSIDLDAIASGALRGEGGVVQAPEAKLATLPPFVVQALGRADLKQGTVVLLEKLDKLSSGYVLTSAFKENELHHVGLVYRDLLRNVRIRFVDVADKVDSRNVEPIDPLFLRPDARYYNENPVPELPTFHAEALPSGGFTVKSPNDRSSDLGAVRIRYSYMPPGFMDGKSRLKVRKENWGIIVMRAGRQIDVLRNFPESWRLAHQGAYDRYWAVEIDFDPALDEEFGVTTNKQQIVISESMWGHLKENGVPEAIRALRTRFKNERKADEQKTSGKRESEDITSEAAKFRGRKVTPQTPEKERKRREALDREARRIAARTKRPVEDVRAEIEQTPNKIEFESLQGAPFYRGEQVGGQKRLYINTAHRFYSDVYSNPESTPRLKTSLELLLWVLVECEIEAIDDREIFYVRERTEWSTRLETALQLLDRRSPLVDERAAAEAIAEEAAVERETAA
jgi:histidine kinase/DNA gyrase B/HSP90-like ATPase